MLKVLIDMTDAIDSMDLIVLYRTDLYISKSFFIQEVTKLCRTASQSRDTRTLNYSPCLK